MKNETLGTRIFNAVNIIMLVLFAFMCLYPFWYIVVLSFNDGKDAVRGGIFFWPREFSLVNYITIFKDDRLLNSALISVFRTTVGTALALIANTLYAYAISKADLPGKKFLNFFIIIPMYFNAGIIPYYVLCNTLGLVNNIWVYVLPWIAVPFHIMLLRVHIKELPASLEESAQMDGANFLVIFIKIIFPLTLPALATVALLAGIMHWNDWLDGTIMVTRDKYWPLQTLLLNILQGADAKRLLQGGLSALSGPYRKTSVTGESVKMAMIVISVVPIVMFYPFAQRYFISGMMVGSVKE